MNSELLQIKDFFKSNHIPLSDEWLDSCVNWCKEEILTTNYTIQDLQKKIYEQWLLLDLRLVSLQTLPTNLDQHTKYTLNGKYTLQIMQIIDITKPKLWQLQRIRNSIILKNHQQDMNEIGTGKRMLQLTLTDGVQEIEAIEYKPIHQINLNLPPGSKMLITGPVTIRRGRLMLESQNVRVLGGEVEELVICNAAENVLARLLNLPENPNPHKIEEDIPDQPVIDRTPVLPPIKPQIKTDLTDEDEMKIAEEIDLLLATEQEIFQGNPVESSTTSFTFENDGFDDMLIDEGIEKIEEIILSQTNDVIPLENLLGKTGTYRTRAKFKRIIEKLTETDDEFKFIIEIIDGNVTLVVKIDSDLISEIVGFAPSEVVILKNRIQMKNKEAANKVTKALETLKNKLLQLDLIEIYVNNSVAVLKKIL